MFIFENFDLHAQGSLTNPEIDNYKEQVTILVKYLEGTLNFLGDPQSVSKEKEIIINESYLKIFENDKVQVEDDLDENREVPLHKDVQAYLKDIEFFFISVKFEFAVAEIEHFVNGEEQHYFKVSFNRTLKGITINGDTVESKKMRFMEINLNIADNDLKIASIYTTKPNVKEEIKNWWNNLTYEWREIFGENIFINDSIRLADIASISDSLIITAQNLNTTETDTLLNYNIELPEERQASANIFSSYDTIYIDTKIIFTKLNGILKQQKIDISGNEKIRILEPLSKLTELREINCSKSLINDLSPLRNLNHIETLNCSEAPIDDLSPIQYSTSIKNLNCSYTLLDNLSSISGLINIKKLSCSGIRITDLSFAANFINLESLDCSSTRIHDLESIKDLTTLESLNISDTKIMDLNPVDSLTKLRYLNCENSSVVSLEPLKNLSNLEVLRISHTEINSLQPLNDIESLQKIYCDDTEISKEEAIQFMRSHTGCLVIFESEELLNGWNEMEQAWIDIAKNYAEISDDPTKEELHALIKIEKMDLSGNKNITTLNPVRRLYNLKTLNISGVQVTDFTPVEDVIELEELDISNTSVKNLDFLSNLKQLQELNIENTAVESLEPIENLKNLNIIYADNSGINNSEAFKLREFNPGCIIIYKTEELESWWQNLSGAWKDFFSGQFKMDSPPTKEQLHKILLLDSLSVIDNNQINDLSPLSMLQGLKTLHFSGTQVNDLQPLVQLRGLQSIQCSQNPVSDISPLTSLLKLNYLDIENTPVSDLKPISNLNYLKTLNCSGTQIKSLKYLANLTNLRTIELNNTAIKSLKPLLNLPELKTLRCYNTRISSKNIDKFKNAKPQCEVVYY